MLAVRMEVGGESQEESGRTEIEVTQYLATVLMGLLLRKLERHAVAF